MYNRPLDREREPDRPRLPPRTKEPQEVPDTLRRPNIYDRTTEKSTTTSTTSEPESDTEYRFTDVPDRHHEPHDRRPESSERRPESPERRPESLPEHVERRPFRPTSPKSENPLKHFARPSYSQEPEQVTPKDLPNKYWKPIPRPETPTQEKEESNDEYSSEYYDETEETTTAATSPKPSVRVVKRPFLPSRGGNPNPRGLLPVGSKATTSSRRDEYVSPFKTVKPQDVVTSNYRDLEKPKERLTEHHQDNKDRNQQYHDNKDRNQHYQENKDVNQQYQEDKERVRHRYHEDKNKSEDNKRQYDNYKLGEVDIQPKQQQDEYEIARPNTHRPEIEPLRKRPDVPEKSTPNWADYRVHEETNEATGQGLPLTSAVPQFRGNHRHLQTENPNLYSSSYKNDEVKQRINEVTHKLQDIPESEYDVTLNEALTPSLNQESNLPSGFALPLHRQQGRDTILQSSENNYKFSRPLNQQQPQQKTFLPSQQFVPSAGIGRNDNERPKPVYYRNPEIQISGVQYRQQRGPWQDYTGF